MRHSNSLAIKPTMASVAAAEIYSSPSRTVAPSPADSGSDCSNADGDLKVCVCVCVCSVNKVDTFFSKHAQSFHCPSHRRLISPSIFLHLNNWTSTSSNMLQIATLSCHTTLKPRSPSRSKLYQMMAPSLKWR